MTLPLTDTQVNHARRLARMNRVDTHKRGETMIQNAWTAEIDRLNYVLDAHVKVLAAVKAENKRLRTDNAVLLVSNKGLLERILREKP